METKHCTECGDEINPKRLIARPNARMCIPCQTELEQRGHFQLHKMDVQPNVHCGEVENNTETIVWGTNG